MFKNKSTIPRPTKKKRAWSYIVVFVTNIVCLLLINHWMPGVKIESPAGATAVFLAFALILVAYHWLFLHVLTHLVYWLFPLFSALLVSGLLYILVNLVPGIVVADLWSSLIIVIVLVGVNSLLAAYFSIELYDAVLLRLARRVAEIKGEIQKTEEPGILFIEIDGLSESMLRSALHNDSLPTIQRLLESGEYMIKVWESDYSSQTGAIQSGLLLGNNDEIPAYRWWDRERGRLVRSGSFRDAFEFERSNSTGEGLLSNGGASRSNMYSGDAAESMLTISTVLKWGKVAGPGYYVYLLNPLIFSRFVFGFLFGVLREWMQNLLQWIRRDPRRAKSRNFFYAFTRAITCQILHDLITLLVIGDVLRGIPAIYVTFPGYDDVAHYTGVDSAEAYQTLEEMDHNFARIEHALSSTPRPYKVVILSDHGQTPGGTFETVHGVTLDRLVRDAIEQPVDIYTAGEVSEAWERFEASLVERQQEGRRYGQKPAAILRHLDRKKDPDQLYRTDSGPKDGAQTADKPKIAALASGCSGLIYFTDSESRLSLEDVQTRCPNLVYNLVEHPGVGFVVGRSEAEGNLVLGKLGVYYLDQGLWEGENPLQDFSPNAPALLRRVCGFKNAADVLISTVYDPQTGSMCCFENQSGHHGGIGGDQSFPFFIHPVDLAVDGEIVGAEALHRLLKGWRDSLQEKAD